MTVNLGKAGEYFFDGIFDCIHEIATALALSRMTDSAYRVETTSRLAQWRIDNLASCTYRKSDPFKIGKWNWYLSIYCLCFFNVKFWFWWQIEFDWRNWLSILCLLCFCLCLIMLIGKIRFLLFFFWIRFWNGVWGFCLVWWSSFDFDGKWRTVKFRFVWCWCSN